MATPFPQQVSLDSIFSQLIIALNQGGRVLNMSLNIEPVRPMSKRELRQAKMEWRKSLTPLVKRIRAKNTLLVLAAGNNGLDGDDNYLPKGASSDDVRSWKENVIIVGASDRQDHIASFSDRGKTVDVYAPGEEIEIPKVASHGQIVAYIVQLVAPGAQLIGEKPPTTTTETVLGNGTSFAAPLVTGVLALALSIDGLPSDIPASHLKQLLVETSNVTSDGVRIPDAKRLVDAVVKLKRK